MTVKAYGPGITDPSGTVKKRVGDIVPLIALPDECARFDQWEVLTGSANVENAASPTTTITVKENPITLIAYFSKKTFTLNIESTSGGNAIPAGTTTVTCGVSTSVYANPEGDYNFTNWSIESGFA